MKDPFDQPSDPSAVVKTMEAALAAGLLKATPIPAKLASGRKRS